MMGVACLNGTSAIVPVAANGLRNRWRPAPIPAIWA